MHAECREALPRSLIIQCVQSFSGTSGSRRFDSPPSNDPNASASTPAGGPTPSPNLRDHIDNVDKVGKQGISGCHNSEIFEEALEELGGTIESREPVSSIDGVEVVTYRLPKRDRQGNPTDEMRSTSFTKTVFDPDKISTDEYVGRGMEAAAEAASRSDSGTLGHEWTGTDSQGVTWHGYTDSNGNVHSFYPTD